jgi:hypothetical protein
MEPNKFAALIMTEFEHIIWLERFVSNTMIKISDINYNKCSEN